MIKRKCKDKNACKNAKRAENPSNKNYIRVDVLLTKKGLRISNKLKKIERRGNSSGSDKEVLENQNSSLIS